MTTNPPRTSAKPSAAPAGQLSAKTLTGIIASLALAAFMMILNETVLTVALPGIMQDMGISASTG